MAVHRVANPEQWPFWRWMTLKKLVIIMAAVIIVISVWRPPFPVPIKIENQKFFDAIEELPRGSVVIIGLEMGDISKYDTSRDAYTALMIQICRHHLKFIVASFGLAGALAGELMVKRANIEQAYGYVYGVDYVILPYAAGEETAMASFAANIQAVYSTDNRGNLLSSLPLMQKVHSLKDAQLAIGYNGTNTVATMYVRQWAAAYPDVTYLAMGGPVDAYIGTLVKGLFEATSYEVLVGAPGEELLCLLAGNVKVVVFFMVIVAAIKYQIDRIRHKRIAVEGEAKK